MGTEMSFLREATDKEKVGVLKQSDESIYWRL